MPCIEYVPQNFQQKSLDLIEVIDEVIEDFISMGYQLTLRQVYYQLVTGNFIPNDERSYKSVGDLLNNARLAGLIDWESITDRTRNIEIMSLWESPADILRTAALQFKRDLWKDQENYVEVWVEKDALKDIVGQACHPFRVPYFSCRGYVSQSEMWSASQRLIKKSDAGKICTIIHLGDHDPSGIDMSRDIQDRMNLFCAEVSVRRIALTMDQIEEYNPPPNPAKITDTRAGSYISRYGSSSWELDALHPQVLTELIQNNIAELFDSELGDSIKEQEEKEKDEILEWVYTRY